ncbi:unnamed protein product [Paramecium pentaurelia]|uniref:PX domain-containing protein n=1 Tax=Paramecium pentaurelia TaxID=43138 RepID=A0A8S1TR24_9CILI|nr:unnamed protein product [Paramecium pentaurelia]
MQENEFPISICVPSFKKNDDVVYYQLIFIENNQRCTFSVDYRYSHLKLLHESLSTLKASLPKFPPTNWWRSTNNNEELIEERRIQLDYFFKNLFQCQGVCKSLIMKNFILKSQCLYLKKVEKQQRDILKKERKAQATPSLNKQKSKSQLTTPIFGPAEDPIEDPRERSRSWEFKLTQKKSQQVFERDSKQLNNLNFGGVPIFKGILLRFK